MRDRVVFYVNSTRHEVSGRAALQTLAEYLRMGRQDPFHERLTGTKIACAEGDCGACTVLVGRPAANGAFEYQSVDACIAFVFQIDTRHVVTVEGLRHKEALTVFQSAMITNHGSQCGFCTPGFVMALHGMAEELHLCNDNKQWDDQQVRLALSGNLCRCTGYQQILEAAASVDSSTVQMLKDAYDAKVMLEDFATLAKKPVCIDRGVAGLSMLAVPRTLAELLEFRKKMPNAKLVAGATDVGVQHNHGKRLSGDVIATNQVDELRVVRVERGVLIIGATATWQQIAECLKVDVPEYHDLLMRFGSPQVRHFGTLVGNLANASPIGDSLPFHFVAMSTIEVTSAPWHTTLAHRELLSGIQENCT